MKSLHLFVLPLALCASAASLAADAPAADAAPAMKAAIDRDTGKLRAPTAQEQAAMASAESGSRAELRRAGIRVPETEAEALRTQRVHRNGSVSMDVPMSLMSSLVAERDADGNLVIRHGQEHAGHGHGATRVEVADE